MFLNGSEQTHIGIKRKILELENQFNVDEWIVNDINVWPYIRIKLFFLLITNLNPDSEKQKGHHTFNKEVPTTKKAHKVQKGLRSIGSFIKNEIFFLKLKTKKIVFFGSHIHRVKHENNYFNRFFDSMVDFHNLEEDVYMIEHQKVYDINYNQKAVIKLEQKLHDYKVTEKIKSKLRSRKITQDLEGYEEFLSLVNKEVENSNTLHISFRDLVNWSVKIKSLASFFTRMFKKIKPDKVLFPGYYAWDNLYAAVLAANNLKIKTVDFQHGPQTNVHMVLQHGLKFLIMDII